MEIELRVILLTVGLIIISRVAYDYYKRKMLQSAANARDYTDIKISENDTSESELETILVQEPHHSVDSTQPALDIYEASAMEILPGDEEIIAEDLEHAEIEQIEPENIVAETIINVSIMTRDSNGFVGKDLLDALQNAHIYLGEHDIFYRFDNDDGTGEVLFRIVNAVEPGYFFIATLPDDVVTGITLILLPQRVNDPNAAFDKFVRAAKQLAFALNGQLLDHERQPLTTSTIEQYRKLAQIKNERYQCSY